MPHSACRCCAAGNTLGSSSSRTAPTGSIPEEEVEALQTTAMVVAEMLATGELQALAPIETGIAPRRPVYQKGVRARRRRRASAMWCSTSPAW